MSAWFPPDVLLTHKFRIFDMFRPHVWLPDLSSWENIQFFMEKLNPTSKILDFLTHGPKIEQKNNKHLLKTDSLFDLCLEYSSDKLTGPEAPPKKSELQINHSGISFFGTLHVIAQLCLLNGRLNFRLLGRRLGCRWMRSFKPLGCLGSSFLKSCVVYLDLVTASWPYVQILKSQVKQIKK